MVTCPWCGTKYMTFQSNCYNCGGQLDFPTEPTPFQTGAVMVAPPPAPRVIADNFARKQLLTNAWAITAGTFALLGVIFTTVGFFLTIAIITAFVGIPFLFFGGIMLVLGFMGLRSQYQQALEVVNTLRHGEPVVGQVLNVEENFTVRVNQRHPWIITYRFQANGRDYEGRVSTLNTPELQKGQAVYVLYLPHKPESNALYPHP